VSTPKPRQAWTTPALVRLTDLRRQGLTARELAEVFGRTKGAIGAQLTEIKATKQRLPHRIWSDAEKERLTRMVSEGAHYAEIAAQIGRTPRAVENMAGVLNLRRPKIQPDSEPRLSRAELAIWRRQIVEESDLGLSRSELAIWRAREAR
jgi:DNA-binding CsgD family transcriptional regulator